MFTPSSPHNFSENRLDFPLYSSRESLQTDKRRVCEGIVQNLYIEMHFRQGQGRRVMTGALESDISKAIEGGQGV